MGYNLTGIENWEELDNVASETIAYQMLFIGIMEITEDNVVEVFTRISANEKLLDLSRRRQDEDGNLYPLYFTFEEVEKYIGLRCNISTLTKTQFQKKLYRQYQEKVSKELQN